MKNSPPAPGWTSAQWLSLLIVAALAGAGWVQAAKWKRQANDLQAQTEQSGISAGSPAIKTSSGLALPRSSDSSNDDATVSLMEDIDLMRQVDLLTSENQRLSEELKRVRENSTDDSKAERDRAAIDGTDGGSILR